MPSYISEDGLYCLWIVGGLGTAGIAIAVFLWSDFIGDVRRQLLLSLGGIASLWALICISSGIYGLLTDDTFPFLSLIRAVGNALLPVAVGSILLWIALASRMMPTEEQVLIRQAAKVFGNLKKVLHETR